MSSVTSTDPDKCGGNLLLSCSDFENQKSASIALYNRYSDINTEEYHPLTNKVITLCISNDTGSHSVLADVAPGVEALSDNFLLGSIESSWVDVTGAFFQWIKGENRLNICGMGYDSG
jgi:hypothetical protein